MQETSCSAGDAESIPGSERPPGEGDDSPLQCLAWEIHGQRSLADYSPWGHKSQAQISD